MKFLAALLVAVMLAVDCFAATTSVTLAWDANTEADLAGYKLYVSAVSGGPYTETAVLGKVVTYTADGVTDGNHCWVLTAYDIVGNESGYSNEVCLQLDTEAPSVPQGFIPSGLVRVR